MTNLNKKKLVWGVGVLLGLFLHLQVGIAQTTVTINCTGTVGSFNSGSVNSAGTKNDGNMTGVNSTTNRGWARFDLSTLPAGAVISSANVIFSTITGTASSSAINNIYGFIGNPSSIAGATLYTNCASGTSFNASSWTYTTSPTVNTKALNATGIAFLQSNITSTQVCLGFVRGSTNTYVIGGYGQAAANQPQLQITYNIPSPCTGTPAPGNTISSAGSTICPGASTTLSLQNGTTGTGVSYQWKANGTNIGGATASTYLATPSSTTTYTCDVTCATTGNTGTSNGLSVSISSPTNVVSGSPWTESFESVATGNNTFPSCWSFTNGSGNWITATSIDGINPRTGSRLIYRQWNTNGTFVTQGFNLTAGKTYEFKFYYTESRGNTGGNWNITTKVGTVATYASMTNTLGSINNPAGTAYKDATYTFSPGSSGTYFFGISCSESTGVPWYMVFDDFSVTELNPCSGTPTVGAISATSNPVCVGISNTLTVANQAALLALQGISFQWDSSTNGGTTWAPKILATGVSLVIPTQSVNTMYRLNATCSNSGLTGTSSPITINMNTPTNCYCTPAATNGCVDGDVIARVKLNKLDNNSGTGCPSSVPFGCTLGTCTNNGGYSNYTTNPALRDTLQPATTYGCTVWAGQYGENYRVWIDYNDDGFFDNTTESVGYTSTTVAGSGTVGVLGSSATFPISLACTPPAGLHRMRVRCVYGISNGSTIDPCATVSYGETEDYQVYITPAAPCIPAGAMNATSKVGTYVDTLSWVKNCANANNYDFQYGPTGFTLGTGTIIANQFRPDSTFILTGLNSNTTYDVYYRTNCGGGATSGWSPAYTFTTLPSCFPPSGLTPGTPTGTTCSVSWTANPLNPSATYRYFINTTGTAPTTGDTGIACATTTVNIGGLTPTTQYYVWVKSYCGGSDYSAWSTNTTFTTIPCIPIYTTGTSAGDLISNVKIIGTTLNNTSGFVAGTPSFVNYYNSTNPAQTATLQPSANYDLVISTGEWGDQNYAAWIDYNDDGIFSTPSERIGFTPTRIGTGFTSGQVNATGTFTISLSCTPPPGPHRMRIRGVYSTTNIGATIDPCASNTWGETEDYKITIAPPNVCPSGGVLSATGATTNSVNLNWSTGCATATAWDFQYGPKGFTLGTGTSVNNVSAATSYVLTGLLSGVQYDVYYRASCSGGAYKSAWSNKASFQTICEPPTGLKSISVTNNNTIKTWNKGRAENMWDMYISTSGTPPSNTATGSFENITARPYNIGSLSTNTVYYTWVRAQCHSADSSVWSLGDTFQTLPSPVDTLLFQNDPYQVAYKLSTSLGITASGRTGCSGTNADDDKYFIVTKPAGITRMQVVVVGSSNYDPVFEVMTGTNPSYSSLACVNVNAQTAFASESYVFEGLPTTEQTYTIRVYHAGAGSGSGAFSIACYYKKHNATNIVPCNAISSSNNSGSVATNQYVLAAYDNGYIYATSTNLNALPPYGPNLVYYTGTTAFAPFVVGPPLPTCGTTTATPKRVYYAFRAPSISGVSVEFRTAYTSTSANTILEAMSTTGVPCPTTYNIIKCSTTGVLTLTAADLAPYAGQLIYVQLTQNGGTDNGITYMLSVQGITPTVSADSSNEKGFRIVLPATAPTNLSKYRVYWRTVGASGYSFRDVAPTATSTTLNNLNSGTLYEFWVGYYSSVNSQIFISERDTMRTVAGCSGPLPAPTVITAPAPNTSCTKVLVTWPSFAKAGSALKYRLYYRLSSAPSTSFSVFATNDTFMTISNLTLNASYEFFYKAICANTSSSVSGLNTTYVNCGTPKKSESSPNGNTFTINGITYVNADFRDLVAAVENGNIMDGDFQEVNIKSDEEIVTNGSIQLYPNPASEYVVVTYMADLGMETNLKLTTLDGKVVKSTTMNTDNAVFFENINKVKLTTRIDLRDYQAGMYLISVSQEGNRESKQLIVIK